MGRSGVAAVDFDNDGWIDLVMSGTGVVGALSESRLEGTLYNYVIFWKYPKLSAQNKSFDFPSPSRIVYTPHHSFHNCRDKSISLYGTICFVIVDRPFCYKFVLRQLSFKFKLKNRHCSYRKTVLWQNDVCMGFCGQSSRYG